MPQDEFELHKRIARECFNETWNYLEKEARSEEDDRIMLNLTHASRYHWSLIGNAENLAVGDWQISRVYSALKQPMLALQFAKSSLELCERSNLSSLIVSAYEGIARAYAVNNDTQSARIFIKKAREQLTMAKVDDEDRRIFLDQILETEKLMGE